MKGTKGIHEVFERTVFVVLTHGNIVAVLEGIAIFNDRIQESAVLARHVLWRKFKGSDSPLFEEFGILSNNTVGVLTWCLNEILEVWEAFVNDLWVKSCWWFKDLLTLLGRRSLGSGILVFWGTYWHPNCQITWNFNGWMTSNIICCEGQVPLIVRIANQSSWHIRILEVGRKTCRFAEKQWTVSLIFVGSSHIDHQTVICSQLHIWTVGCKDEHSLVACFGSTKLVGFFCSLTITHRWHDFIAIKLSNLHVLTTCYIFDASTEQGIDGIIVWWFFSHVLAIVGKEVPVVNTSDTILVGQHCGIGSWDIVLGVLFISLAHVRIVDFKSLFELIHSEGETICFWINLLADDIGQNSLHFTIMGTHENIIGITWRVFLLTWTIVKRVSNHSLQATTVIALTQESCQKRFT